MWISRCWRPKMIFFDLLETAIFTLAALAMSPGWKICKRWWWWRLLEKLLTLECFNNQCLSRTRLDTMRYVLPTCLAYDHARGRIGHRIILLSFVRLRIQKMITFEESLLGICDTLFASLCSLEKAQFVLPLWHHCTIWWRWCSYYPTALVSCLPLPGDWLSTTPDTAVAATTGVKPQPTLEQRNLQACACWRNLRFLLNTTQSQSNSITWVASLKV